ncbi:MAG: hypothetical protein JJ863_14125 [Deltaproteobacteria bacterium]|nr:hypothetical protein [Deltaproteobacteria bacterium]
MKTRHGIGLASLVALLMGTLSAQADTFTLTDSSGLEWYVNHDITFTTDESASGAFSDATYTMAVNATTEAGGTTTSTLGDAFDGYNGLLISTSAATNRQPDTSTDSSFNENGPATLTCTNREVTYATQVMGSLSVTRRTFIPDDATFARTLDIITNTSAASVTFSVAHAHNLGSDSNTIITASSSGDLLVTSADTWAASMQDFNSSGTSSDPRLGHVLQGEGTVRSPVAHVLFADGENNPYVWYDVTLAAGETGIIMTFVSGHPSMAAAATQAASLASLTDAAALRCMTPTEQGQLLNFATTTPVDCGSEPDGTACDDGDLCTTGDMCMTGACVGTAVSCRADASDCTGVCNPSTGACDDVAVADDETCDDGDACNGGDTCQSGVCTNTGTALDCDDSNACTTDSCDTTSGCMNMMMSGCMACSGDTDCDDSNACNGAETCGADGTCEAGTVPDCDDGDECTMDSCDATSGCTNTPIAGCGEMPDGGTTMLDAGTGPRDGGTSTPDGGPVGGGDDDGCGCRTAGASSSSSPGALLFGLLLGGLVVRRRRRSR